MSRALGIGGSEFAMRYTVNALPLLARLPTETPSSRWKHALLSCIKHDAPLRVVGTRTPPISTSPGRLVGGRVTPGLSVVEHRPCHIRTRRTGAMPMPVGRLRLSSGF